MSLFVKSTSGEFYCDIAVFQYTSGDDRRYAVYSKATRGHPVAWIMVDSGFVARLPTNQKQKDAQYNDCSTTN